MMTADTLSNPGNPIVSIGGIIDRQLKDLKPSPTNPRTHSEKQVTKLKASIGKFGFTVPLMVDESGTILSGHGRFQAAQELGLASIPVRVISGWTESQKRAYVIADNKLALLSSWDNGLLKSEIELLVQEYFEVETIGFSTAEIDIMFDDGQETFTSDPDDLKAGDIAPDTVSRVGDVWQLGHHRLICGSALDAECYKTLMQNELAQMVISDPPYNVAISGFAVGKGKHKEFAMASGEMSKKDFTIFLNTAFSHTQAFSQDGTIHYYCMDWRHLREILDATHFLFGPPRQLCVWVKENGGMGSFYRSQHELVFVFKNGSAQHINNFELGQHGRYRTNVWSYPGIGNELLALHPTIKPTGLIADAIRDCSHRTGIILDPFAGSGTVFIAAERTGRYARGIELDPQYVDVAINRWQRVTAMHATLAATDQTWDKVRIDRLAVKASAMGGCHGV